MSPVFFKCAMKFINYNDWGKYELSFNAIFFRSPVEKKGMYCVHVLWHCGIMGQVTMIASVGTDI